MNKASIITIIVVVLGIGAGIATYEMSGHSTSSNNSFSSSQTATKQSAKKIDNTSANRTSSSQTIQTNNTAQSKDKSTATNHNGLFGYNIGFNVLFSENIGSEFNQYHQILENKFKELYGSDKDVTVNVSNIYITNNRTSTYVAAIYKVDMDNGNSSDNWYGSNAEQISVKIGANNSGIVTATFPNTWNYTTSPVMDNGVKIPNGTSYVDMKTIYNTTQKVYFPSLSYNTPVNKNVQVYSQLPTMQNGSTPTTITMNTNHLQICAEIQGYFEVTYGNSNNISVGYIKADESGINLAQFDRKPLGVQSFQGIYNSSVYNHLYSSPILSTVNSNTSLLEYPSTLSNSVAKLPDGGSVEVLTLLYGYSLISSGGTLGWTLSSNVSENNANLPMPRYTSNPDFSTPIGYTLHLEGQSGEGSYQNVLKTAMNREFDGTGDIVTATDTQGFAGMMHYGADYNVTYTTPSGQTVRESNKRIAGLTDPDSGSYSVVFDNQPS